jgi:tRNA G37 N-methylase Trm5
MAEISSAIEFLKRIRAEDFVIIKFIKQDGTERIMKCTLNFDKIPLEFRPKKVDLGQILKLIHENGILHVFDMDKIAWRSIPFERVKWLQTPSNVRFHIKVKKEKGEK